MAPLLGSSGLKFEVLAAYVFPLERQFGFVQGIGLGFRAALYILP